jgi:protein TonB
MDRAFTRTILLPAMLAMLIHISIAGTVEGGKRLGWWGVKPKKDAVVEFVVAPPPPPKKVVEPPPPPPDQPPPPPKPVAAQPKPVAKVAPKVPVAAAPPPSDQPPPPPAPGPPSDEPPPEEYTYKMPEGVGGGSMGVQAGAGPTGSARGVKGGTGPKPATGGGTDPDATGPRVASIASIKDQPRPLGEPDRFDPKEYPDEAKRAGIEGDVLVRILVDDEGKPARVRVLRGLGHGLDEKALELARRIRFKPAIDTTDKPVATEITWTFHFKLPD